MNDIRNFFTNISEKVVSNELRNKKRKNLYDNRFNYVNTIVSILALVLSVISILMQL